jgi:hypothetical protein
LSRRGLHAGRSWHRLLKSLAWKEYDAWLSPYQESNLREAYGKVRVEQYVDEKYGAPVKQGVDTPRIRDKKKLVDPRSARRIDRIVQIYRQ